jgi:tetratricopeptide (TPR) repeat protein
MQKDYEGARDHIARALELLRAEVPEQHSDVAIAAANLAQAMALQGQNAEAAEVYETLLHQQAEAYGRDHIDVARIEHAYALVLGRLGRNREAFEHADHAVVVFEKVHGPEHAMVARGLNLRAMHELALRDFAAALATAERAAKSTSGGAMGPELEGEAHFLLAHALVGERRDRSRAIAAAETARKAFAREPWLADRVAEVDRWLAENGAPSSQTP